MVILAEREPWWKRILNLFPNVKQDALSARQILSQHWTTLVTWGFLLGGLIFQVGFQARDIRLQREHVASLQRAIEDRKELIQNIQMEVLKLQMTRDVQGNSLADIRTEVGEIRKITQQTDKTVAILLQSMSRHDERKQ